MTTHNPAIGKVAHRLTFLATLALLFIIALSCSDDDNSTPSTTTKIKLSTSSTLGSYLTDGSGNALYLFASDATGANTCTGGCATNWPVFFAENLTQELLGDGLTLADFATITSNGKQQTTYKGWPLYYYAPAGTREAANQTTGEGVNGVWFVAKADYSILLANEQLIGKDGVKYKSDYTAGEGTTLYFTDAKGRTLYTFIADKKNINTYTTGNAASDAIWPVYAEAMGSVPSTLDKSLFGTITVTGKSQVTYKGWPLYYYGSDTQRGDNKGVSVPTPGVWPVAVKDVEAAPEPEAPKPEIVVATDDIFGSYLTDADNRTLYFFASDAAGTNNCTGGCTANWPIFYIEDLAQEKIGEGLSLADFGTITTPGGEQTTYKGWPLYYYAPGGTPEAAGDINGDAVNKVWFVAKPDYTVMIANAQLVGKDGKNYISSYTEGTGLTKYFVNAKGITLYAFSNDKANVNNFSNGVPQHDTQWPVFIGPLVNIPSILDKSLFGSITVFGQTQLTYKGWPMYYYGEDTKRGDNKGVSVPAPGTWPVITQDMTAAPQ